MTVFLDGQQMVSREAAHNHLREKLEFPPWYGRNLDALYDLLTERGRTMTIILYQEAAMLEALGDYGHWLLETLEAAQKANPALRLERCPGQNAP